MPAVSVGRICQAGRATRARANGFDLHAGVVVPAGQRARLERVCRYVLRPPVAQEGIHLAEDGQVRLSLRRPWRDGTTALVFDPVEFLGRLAVLVPRPRIDLVLYHGVLGPRAARRAEVVPQPSPDAASDAMMDGTVADGATSAGVTTSAETARRQARGERVADSGHLPSRRLQPTAPGAIMRRRG